MAGGAFTTAGGVICNAIVRWNGPAAGSVQTHVVLRNNAALVGGVFHQQVVPIELSGTGSITALTGTNALTLTIGSF